MGGYSKASGKGKGPSGKGKGKAGPLKGPFGSFGCFTLLQKGSDVGLLNLVLVRDRILLQ